MHYANGKYNPVVFNPLRESIYYQHYDDEGSEIREGFLLQEIGPHILLEDGGKIVLEVVM